MARQRKTEKSTQAPRLVLDSGAVIALSRGSERARAFVASARESGSEVFIPSVVLAEVLRGSPRDAPINQFLKAVDSFVSADEQIGRKAGALLGAGRSTATIDALVVASALALGGGRILTGEVKDVTVLARAAPGVSVHKI
jgi:predicted nucleic acid-binding protein